MQDLVIIGGGPGGYVAAIRASQLGMQVTLVEKDRLGGTCLNRGCIPTKAYYQTASLLRDLQQLDDFGITAQLMNFDMATTVERKEKVVNQLVTGIEQLLAANKVEVIQGTAQIESANRVNVEGQIIETERILLAAGSCSSRPPIPGIDLPGVLDSDQLLQITEVPQRLVVIGGGVIGLEFACIFHAFGSQVTVVEFLPQLLSTIDSEIGKRMRVFLKRQGITVHTKTKVTGITQQADALAVTAEGKSEMTIDADTVLVATGRRPNTAQLNLDQLGIATNKQGCVIVDDNFQTSVPGIYAIGDIIGGSMLAHVASAEGCVAVERMTGLPSEVAYHAVPSVVFTAPEIASVGLSEDEAKQRQLNYRVGKSQFAANSKAVTMGDTDGLVKIIADEDDTIIGTHIIGPHAADLIQAASVAVRNRLKIADLAATIHAHPTLSEALLEAVLDIERRAIHLMPRRR